MRYQHLQGLNNIEKYGYRAHQTQKSREGSILKGNLCGTCENDDRFCCYSGSGRRCRLDGVCNNDGRCRIYWSGHRSGNDARRLRTAYQNVSEEQRWILQKAPNKACAVAWSLLLQVVKMQVVIVCKFGEPQKQAVSRMSGHNGAEQSMMQFGICWDVTNAVRTVTVAMKRDFIWNYFEFWRKWTVDMSDRTKERRSNI